MVPSKPFIELLKRSLKSKYGEFIMVNHLLFQCYDINIDSDIGFHYIMHIPDTENYCDGFYDMLLVLDAKVIIDTYNQGHNVLLEKKKETKAKPKEVIEEFTYHITEPTSTSAGYMEIKFIFIVQDEQVAKTVYRTPYPVNEHAPMVENCLTKITEVAGYIMPGGLGVVLDGMYEGIFNSALSRPQIYFYKLRLHDKVVRLPFIKSMFLGAKSYDSFMISVQETTLDSIYLVSYQLTRKGLTEQFFGYVQNF